jgi:hypothetical protein
MTKARRQRIGVVMGCAMLMPAVQAAAQTPRDYSRITVVHEYVPAGAARPARMDIPSNFHVNSVYRDLVDNMLDRSPLFRRQMVRIAAASHLTIWLQIMPQRVASARATTRFVRKDNGQLTASISINPLDNAVELIAHEMEHVIEQLDDVDLAAQAARPGTGVHTSGTMATVFETTRATRIGRRVAAEVQ